VGLHLLVKEDGLRIHDPSVAHPQVILDDPVAPNQAAVGELQQAVASLGDLPIRSLLLAGAVRPGVHGRLKAGGGAGDPGGVSDGSQINNTKEK